MKKVKTSDQIADGKVYKDIYNHLERGKDVQAADLLKRTLHQWVDLKGLSSWLYQLFDNLSNDPSNFKMEALLETVAEHQDTALELIQLFLENDRLEDGLDLILKLLELLPESEGITALDKAITDLWGAPHDAAAIYNLGYAWSLLDKFDYALASYNKALENDPRLVYIYNDRGVLFHNKGLYKEALEDYDKAIELNPGYQLAWSNKGIALRLLGRQDEAQQATNKAIELDPYNSQGYVERGVIFSNQKKYEQAIEDYQKAIQLNPESKQAYGNMGNSLNELGRYEEALDALNHAIRLDSKYVWAFNERGRCYTSLERYEQAVADFNTAIELDATYKLAYANKAYALKNMGRYDEALEALHKTLQLDPNYVWAYNETGRVYDALEKYEEALAEYEKALVVDPTYRWAVANKGYTLRKLGRPEEALTVLNEAIALDPEYAWAYTERGRAYDEMNNYEAAISDYDKALAYDAQYKLAYANKAYALRMLKRFDEAHTALDQTLRLDPNYVWAYNERGRLFLDQGDEYNASSKYGEMIIAYQTSLQHFNHAIELEPSNLYSHWYAGNAYSSLGSYDKSIKAFEKAINLVDQQNTTDIASLSYNQGEDYFRWYQITHHRSRLEKALNAYENARQKSTVPSDLARYCLAVGVVLAELKQNERAFSMLDKAMEHDPAYAYPMVVKGKIYYLGGKWKKAIKSFEQSMELDQKEKTYLAWGLVGLGLAIEKTSETDRAQKLFRQALGEGGDAQAKAYYDRADIFEYYLEYQRAEADYRQAIQITPDDAQAINSLAWLYVTDIPDPENLNKAIRLAQQAIELQTEKFTQANFVDTLAWAYFHLGNYQKALGLLQKIADIMPHSLEVRHHLKRTRMALKKSSA